MEYDYNLHAFPSPKFLSLVNDAIKFLNNTSVHSLPPEGRFIGSGVMSYFILVATNITSRYLM